VEVVTGAKIMRRREPDALEVVALVCTIMTAVLAIADWMLKVVI